MTEKHKDRTINSIISFIIAVGVVFIGADLTSDAAEKKALQDAIKCKADRSYVDSQNDAQDEALNKRFQERDRINAIILEELGYIKRRVDKIPTR